MLIKSLLNQQDEDEDENLVWGVHQEPSGAPMVLRHPDASATP